MARSGSEMSLRGALCATKQSRLFRNRDCFAEFTLSVANVLAMTGGVIVLEGFGETIESCETLKLFNSHCF